MPDQHDRAMKCAEVIGDIVRIGGQALQRVSDCPRVVACRLQRRDLTTPARGIRPRAVNKDHSCLGLAGCQAGSQAVDEP